jgi:hypothetical protein
MSTARNMQRRSFVSLRFGTYGLSYYSMKILTIFNVSVSFRHRWALSPISVMGDIGLSLYRTVRYRTDRLKICRIFRYRTKVFTDIRYPTSKFLKSFCTVGAKSISRFFKSMYFLDKSSQVLGMLESSSFLFARSWPRKSCRGKKMQKYLTLFHPFRFKLALKKRSVFSSKSGKFV